MAEPNMELDTHDDKDSVATYDLAIINNNIVDTDITLRWGGTDSADGSITAVIIPASGDIWAPDFWYEDAVTADFQIMDENTGPDELTGAQCYHLFRLGSDAAYAAAPIITCYDDTGHGATPSDQCLVGTAGHAATFVKIVGATTSGQPAQYWGEASSANLHDLETGNSVVLGVAAQGLNGEVAWMTCTTASINTTNQFFSLALSVPDDATPAVDAVNIVLSVKYQYT